MTTYKYSRWDGSQQSLGPDEDALFESMADDLFAHGDLDRALRSLLQRGFDGEDGERIEGLRDLLERLRQQRQTELERHRLDSLMDEVRKRLEVVVGTERAGIDRRLSEARHQLAEDDAPGLREAMQVLEERAERSRLTLDSLPESTAGAVRELSEYDFIDPEARERFQELLDLLDQQMADNLFQDMRRQLQTMGPEQTSRLKDMLGDLNRMLRDRAAGLAPDFQEFMDRHGDLFDPDRPASLDELVERLRQSMAAAQSLAESLSPEMRSELEALTEAALGPDLRQELAELAAQIAPYLLEGHLGSELEFLGKESVTLEQAMDLLAQLRELDEIEEELERAMRGGIDDVDLDRIEQQLGPDARQQLEQLQRIAQQLREAGYLKRAGDKLELTPRAIRKLGQRALREVFAALKTDRFGRHELHSYGDRGYHTGDTRPYEFGDPFDIDLQRTLLNATVREEPKVPVKMRVEDMEVHPHGAPDSGGHGLAARPEPLDGNVRQLCRRQEGRARPVLV